MNKNQRIIFWSMFISFCFCATLTMYASGFVPLWDRGTQILLVIVYLVCGLGLHRWVKTNPKEVDKFFD